MTKQQSDILLTFPQWRKMDLCYIEPIVQIFSELAVTDELGQISVGRRYDSYVNRHVFFAT